MSHHSFSGSGKTRQQRAFSIQQFHQIAGNPPSVHRRQRVQKRLLGFHSSGACHAGRAYRTESDRVINWREIRAMLRTMGYRSTGPIASQKQAVAMCFLVALRTGMRSGELCKLTWDRVFTDYCILPETKTVSRKVPFEPRVTRLIERMRGYHNTLVFGINRDRREKVFQACRSEAGLSGFRFHDARHTAATLLAPRLDILDLCKMFGWKNTKQALTYYNPTASDIARRLSGRRR